MVTFAQYTVKISMSDDQMKGMDDARLNDAGEALDEIYLETRITSLIEQLISDVDSLNNMVVTVDDGTGI